MPPKKWGKLSNLEPYYQENERRTMAANTFFLFRFHLA